MQLLSFGCKLIARCCYVTRCPSRRFASSGKYAIERPDTVTIDGTTFHPDDLWNISPGVMRLLDRRLLFEEGNPLNLLKRRIIDYLHKQYRKPASGSPLFTCVENMPRVVSVWENFDSLLTPSDHVSRLPSETYYVNSGHVLRAHTSAHQHSLIRQGFDNFVCVGDVYRRDEIDRTHFPCFHQMEGVRLFSADQLFDKPAPSSQLALFENGQRTAEKQETHTSDCSRVVELSLKNTLEQLARYLFGEEAQLRWVDAYFPFTHPSFELEVLFGDKWLEVLGCGIVEQKLLESAGVSAKVGWAFGLGLERLAMRLYSIPDIRLFWSKDSGFLSQFAGKRPEDSVTLKPVSSHPAVYFDVSFWLPDADNSAMDTSNVFDVIRTVGGDLIEQVNLTDNFLHPKTGRRSHCYRIVYRRMDRAMTKDEVNIVHDQIKEALQNDLRVTPRVL